MRLALGTTVLLTFALVGCYKADGESVAQSSVRSSPEETQATVTKDAEPVAGTRDQKEDAGSIKAAVRQEVVRPRLVEEIHWTPNATVTLAIELVATDESGETRVLSYEQVGDAKPLVEINFLDGDLNYHSLKYVELSDRPGDRVYSAEFELPAGARGADVIVHLELENEDVTVAPLEIKGIPIEYDLFFGIPRSNQ